MHHSLLTEKDLCECPNVSVKFPCVYLCLSSRDLFFFFNGWRGGEEEEEKKKKKKKKNSCIISINTNKHVVIKSNTRLGNDSYNKGSYSDLIYTAKKKILFTKKLNDSIMKNP